MKKIRICAQVVMRILLPTFSYYADMWFVPTVSRKITVIYVVSINLRSAESTGDTEVGCATSGDQSGAPGMLIGEALTMPVDEEEEANRLIDQILDPLKTFDNLTSRMDGAWKFPLSCLIRNTLLN